MVIYMSTPDKKRLRERFRNKKLPIGVLLGGFSSEREISLKSGTAVANALRSLGYTVHPIDVTATTIPELDDLKIEVVFIALHGKFGEDGELQRLLDGRNIIYTGSGAEASRRALDKFATKETFIRYKIPTAPYVSTSNRNWKLEIGNWSFGYPVVVKPRAEGSSVGVSIVKTPAELEAALKETFKYGNDALIEKYITGREVTVGILGDKPLPVIELKPQQTFYDYKAKYQDSHTEYVVNPDLPAAVLKNIQSVGLAAHQALGCSGISRVDMIYSAGTGPAPSAGSGVSGSRTPSPAGGPVVLEVNTIPGLTERSLLPKAARAIGIEFPQLCERIIELALGSFCPTYTAFLLF